MACVNISGTLYPEAEIILNATDSEDSSELVQNFGISSSNGLVENVLGFNFTSMSPAAVRPSSKEIPGIFCMQNPEQMLEPWEINKNLAMLISYSVIFVIGVVGNITAMLGMIGDRKSRNATTLFLVSLSAADLLLLLICAPLEALQYFVIQWDEAGTICKTAKYAEVLSAVASVLNLTAVSLERFIVIVFPIRSRSVCTISNCRRAVLVVWIISLILTAPVLFTKGTNPLTFTDGEQSITINYCEDKGDGRIFAIYQAVILLLAPGLVMIICYTYVIRELWISTRNMRVLTNANISNHHEDQHHETRRWRSRSNRWLDHSTSSNASVSMIGRPLSSHHVTVTTTTGTGSSLVTSTAVPPPLLPAARGHEACLLPCHGPCAASNQASSCQSFVNGRHHHQHHQAIPSTTPLVSGTGSLRREAQLVLARKPLRESLIRNRPTLKKTRGYQARAEDVRNARKQVIKMLILVVVLFLICWGSRLSMEIWIKVGLDTFSPAIYFLRIAINLLPFVHSCLNPFIYSLMSKNFRRSMLRRLHCCFCSTGSSGCVGRSTRCTCQSGAGTVVTGAVGVENAGDHSPSHAARQCQHCQQFSSHYNLNVIVNGLPSGETSGLGQMDQEAISNGRSVSRLRTIATRLTIAASSGIRTPANSPLLVRLRGRSRSLYANSVVTPECAQRPEVDCRV